MSKLCWIIVLFIAFAGRAQTVEKKLLQAVEQVQQDSQMRYAMIGLAVADARTGNMVFEYNANTGLAPASTQKIITSVAAFELLGKDYRFTTRLAHDGKIINGVLAGNLVVIGGGDPALGSWRYSSTKPEVVLNAFSVALKKQKVREVTGSVVIMDSAFSRNGIPDGWIWQDIGNYYGAGAYQLNWKENQFDVVLRSGDRIGDRVDVVNDPLPFQDGYVNELKAAAKGSGDNAYVYLAPGRNKLPLLQGTIPAGERSFTIAAASVDPGRDMTAALVAALLKDTIAVRDRAQEGGRSLQDLYTYRSPALDSIVYWFMRRSINLYGEALMKAIAYEKKGYGSTDGGVGLVRDFFHERGIVDKNAIRIMDGSGLSPQNRVTAGSLVSVLQFARSRPWFASFYESFPVYNGMKLKSGSIGGARAFAGYHTAGDGRQYVVAIIINNYSGSSSAAVSKMYKVLDQLK